MLPLLFLPLLLFLIISPPLLPAFFLILWLSLSKLGLTVAPANSVAGAGKDGVVVTEVDPKSAAAERGFKEGYVILEVAGKSVTTAGDVRDAINAARTDNKNSVLMRVKSGGSSRFVAVPLAKG